MTWGSPAWFALMWGVVAVVVLLVWARRRRRAALDRLAAAGVRHRLVPADLESLRALKSVLLVAALVLLVLAMARPRMGFQWREIEREGLDVVVLLDVSRSMNAQDVSPSRMERARREIRDLMELMVPDRLGLVVFAAGAYPRVPLTLDHEAIRWILDDVGPGTLRAQGTSLAAAIRAGLDLLDRPRASDRALLVISDGEVAEGDDLDAALEEAREDGVPIYALGVGTPEGAPIPTGEGGFKKDRAGQVVVSRLEPSVLRRVASRTRGAFVRSVASRGDVEALVRGEIRDHLTSGRLGVERERVWNEQFQWPLGLGVALLLFGASLVPRRVGVGAALLVAFLASPPARAAGVLEEARASLEAGDHEQAVERLTEAHLRDPHDPELGFALGEALYRAGRYAEAEQVWKRVARQADEPDLKRLARYNMGNAAYHAGRLTDALDHYAQALQEPGAEEWQGLKENAQAVQQEIAARLQQQQEPQLPDQEGSSCPNPQAGEGKDTGSPPSDGEGEQGEQPEQGEQRGEDSQDEASSEGMAEAGSEAPDPRPRGKEADLPEEEQDPGEGEIELAGQRAGAGDTGAGGQFVQPVGALSAEQAERLLEAVEEGSPRVVIGGRSDAEQDW